MVRFENVGMRYGAGPEVLRDISFSLAPASFHFLTGPSGAGKSSLLRLMYLAYRPSRGVVTLFGENVATMARQARSKMRRRIGVIYQDFRLLEHQSVFDNVALPLRIAGAKEDQIRTHVTELLTWVGLEEHVGALPTTLSGGEQQRVAIARAIVKRPAVLLCDEPTGALDYQTGKRVLEVIEHINRELHTTTIVITHNAAIAGMADRVLYLGDGRLQKISINPHKLSPTELSW